MDRSIARRSLMGALAVLLSCGDSTESVPPSQRSLPGAPTVPTVETLDSAGIPIIVNRGPGLLEVDAPLAVTERFRAGGINAPAEEQFFRVADAVLDDDERVFVGNSSDGTIRVFGLDGSFLYQFGGLGEGPGELEEISALSLRGDTLIVLDGSGRIREAASFSLEGDFLSSLSDVTRSGRVGRLTYRTPLGWLGTVTGGNRRQADAPPPVDGDTRESRRYLLELDPVDRVIGDTVVALPPTLEYRSEGRWESPLFLPVFGEGVDGAGYLYVGMSFAYRIDVYSPLGELSWSVRREVPRRPITEADVEQLREEVARWYGAQDDWDVETRTSGAEAEIEEIDRRAAVPFPEWQPVTGELMVSRDGSFWVERLDDLPPGIKEFERGSGWVLRRDRPEYWDIFDSAGHYLGEVALPPAFTPLSVRGLWVVGVTLDEYDLEHVSVFEVVASSPTRTGVGSSAGSGAAR